MTEQKKRKPCPTDLTDAEWRLIELNLPTRKSSHGGATALNPHTFKGGLTYCISCGVQLGGFPGAVIDADVDVGLVGDMAGLARVPTAHLAGGADGMIAVKDRLEALAVFLADSIQHVLNDAAHVERDDEPAAQVVLAEERRSDADAVGADELLHNADELGQQDLAAASPSGFHLVEGIARRLEDDAPGAEFPRGAFQFDAVHLGHVRLTF